MPKNNSRRSAILAALIPVILLSAFFVSPARSEAASPYSKPGMWIWYVADSHGGNVREIIKQARKSRIGTLYIKSGDGTGVWNQFNKKLVTKFQKAGLDVCGWHYVYGERPAAEAKVSAVAKRRGADCFVIDAEAEYEGNYSGADKYVRQLRSRVGKNFPLSLSTFPYAHYHPAFPYSVFLGPGAAQDNLPQVYWDAIGDTVREAIGVTWLQNSIYKREISPVGQTYMKPRARELTAFRRYSQNYGTAPSWWSWQETNKSQWKVLGRRLPGAFPKYRKVTARPTMKGGSRGDQVVWLQQLLNGAGITVPVTGIYGANTKSAIKEFQASKSLEADGVTGTQTWNRLMKYRAVPVRWSGSRSRRLQANISGTASGAPKSASLPMKRNELAGAGNGSGPSK
ncbi:MAG: peptidoglycan-binding domain-containing protein [Solirubrobacterales bacterium]